MTRPIPVISTVIVLAAVAVMVALGFWQLDRMGQKEALLARYAQAGEGQPAVAFPMTGEGEAELFRRSAVECDRVVEIQPTAGRSARGASGWAQRATCATGNGNVLVDLGWTRDPTPVAWSGGRVEGIVASGPRLVASEPPVATMEPLARPDPATIPNNHLAYAVQWFLFAATALVIYWLALKRRSARI